MVPISDTERRRAFSIWLRTARFPRVAVADGVELKFNPWHDPADGRFTFAGSGRNYGQSGGGFTGGGAGSFGGAGASGDWGIDPPKQRTVARASATATERQPSPPRTVGQRLSAATPLRREVRNGYEYQIDETNPQGFRHSEIRRHASAIENGTSAGGRYGSATDR